MSARVTSSAAGSMCTSYNGSCMSFVKIYVSQRLQTVRRVDGGRGSRESE